MIRARRFYCLLLLVFANRWRCDRWWWSWTGGNISSTTTPSALLTVMADPYVQDQWGDYLHDFATIISQTYSVVSDERRVPSGLIQSCVGRGPMGSSSAQVVATVPRGNHAGVIMADQLQKQCGTTNTCILDGHITLFMDAPLQLYALLVRNGSTVLWNDQTQSSHQHVWLCAGYIAIEVGGTFNLTLTGNADPPTNTTVQHNQSSYHYYNNTLDDKYAWIYIMNNGAEHPALRTRVLGAVGTLNPQDIQPKILIRGREMGRTWSSLQQPLQVGQQYLSLMHDPVAMGWRYQDRIAVAPTDPGSTGYGQNFSITGLNPELGFVYLDRASAYYHDAQTSVHDDTAYFASAEVINLSRNVIITGDDYEEIPCDSSLPEAIPGEQTSTEGCRCATFRTSCTVGLHTVHMYGGASQIENVRVEKCGQRGIEGKYCLHFHLLQDCPTCSFRNNAVEVSQQRGLVVHGTHRTQVSSNVFYDVRGANLYLEDGNEMLNTLAYNVAICPWPSNVGGCTIPGTSNDQSDTSINQSGMYMKTPANHLIGNRMANHFNAMFVDAADSGRGPAYGMVCPNRVPFGFWQGNTFHSSGRFGTYALTSNYPLRDLGQSVANNGYTTVGDQCEYFDSVGSDLGYPTALRQNYDYGNSFVGHYQAGDIQYRHHFSRNNLNLLYWKETKSFADGCSAHVSQSYIDAGSTGVGTVAMPDSLGSFIVEHTAIVNASLEANHHCRIGVTGILCMPQYILHNVTFIMNDPSGSRPWVFFNQSNEAGGGGIFSLSPVSAQTASEQASFFPQGYISLVSNEFPWLLQTGLCNSSSSLGLSVRYQDGILCKCQLRALKIYTKGLDNVTAADMHLQVWKKEQNPSGAPPLAEAYIPLGVTTPEKQGYAVPVIPGPDFVYRVSLAGGLNISSHWIVDFSDQTITNRWGVETLYVDVQGRNCGLFVPSNHDRLFLAGNPIKSVNSSAWGHGACTPNKVTPIKSCTDSSLMGNGPRPSYECPSLCSRDCGLGGYCDCTSSQCRCYAGWSGSFCETDVCAMAACVHGACAMRFLGSNLTVRGSKCVCEDGWTGNLCEQETTTNQAIQASSAPSISGTGPPSPPPQGCRGYCAGEWPFGCAQDVAGTVSLMCHPNGGCYYTSSNGDRGPYPGFCVYNGEQALDSSSTCVEQCSGIVHLGCSADLVGVTKYMCNDTYGCYYTTRQDDSGPFPGFCTFRQATIPKPIPPTRSPSIAVPLSSPNASAVTLRTASPIKKFSLSSKAPASRPSTTSVSLEQTSLGSLTPSHPNTWATKTSQSPAQSPRSQLASAQQGGQSAASSTKTWSKTAPFLLLLLTALFL